MIFRLVSIEKLSVKKTCWMSRVFKQRIQAVKHTKSWNPCNSLCNSERISFIFSMTVEKAFGCSEIVNDSLSHFVWLWVSRWSKWLFRSSLARSWASFRICVHKTLAQSHTLKQYASLSMIYDYKFLFRGVFVSPGDTQVRTEIENLISQNECSEPTFIADWRFEVCLFASNNMMRTYLEQFQFKL